MKVTLVSQYFPPEPCAASNRAAALCRELRERGNDVTVVTAFPTFPSGVLRESDRGVARRTEWYEGVRVERLAAFEPARMRGGRLLSWFSFACAAGLRVARARSADVLIVTTPPITLALTAMLAKARHRCRLVVDVRDVFPDVAVAMGAWRRNGPTDRIVGRVARSLYRVADLVVSVTPTAFDLIARRGVPDERQVLAPNGFDRGELPLAPVRASSPDIHAVYAGNLGVAAGIDVILDAAARLRDVSGIRFSIAGSGVEARRIAGRIRDEGLDNIRMLGVLPRARALELLASADVALIPLRPGIRESLPTKLFDALAVSCPVIVSADGEAGDLARASGGGIAVPPGDAEALAGALLELAGDARRRRTMGERGRAYVFERFERGRIMARLCERIAGLDPGVRAGSDRTVRRIVEPSA